jgi:dolichol kinase
MERKNVALINPRILMLETEETKHKQFQWDNIFFIFFVHVLYYLFDSLCSVARAYRNFHKHVNSYLEEQTTRLVRGK